MKRLNGKTLILWIMTLVLCVTTCMPAFASVGDRTLFHKPSEDGSYYSDSIAGVFQLKDGLCIIAGEWDKTIWKYATPQSEPEVFEMKRDFVDTEFAAGDETGTVTVVEGEEGAEMTAEPAAASEIPNEPEITTVPEETQNETETPAAQEDDFFSDLNWDSETDWETPEGEDVFIDSSYIHVDQWFATNGDLYGIIYEQKDVDGVFQTTGASIKHVKLEDGEIILEDSDLPALEMDTLIDEGSFYGLDSLQTVGNYLIGMNYGNDGQTLIGFDLTTGRCMEVPVANVSYDMTYTAGPDGSILYSKRGETTLTGNDFEIIRLDLESGKEETFATLKQIKNYMVPICYDQEKDTLYYTDKGEIWALKQGTEEAVSVNDCPFDARGSMLYDGFMVLWDYSTILMRNLDPAQRSAVTLRVSDTGYIENMSSAVMEMTNERGDISVILDQGSSVLDTGVLQAMMNKDGHTDIYILPYEGKDMQALRGRGYLTEISGNKQIDEYVEKLYPYIRDAVTVDGKLMALPVSASGQGIGVNLKTWGKLGGTEEELPKTWNQFFDWLQNDVPERLAGTEIKLTMFDKSNIFYYLKYSMFLQYQSILNSSNEEQVFNTPLLSSLMKRIEDLDWGALKVSEEKQDSYYIDYENAPLLELGENPCVGRNWGPDAEYLPLSFNEGEEPVVPVSLYVAIINPFSEHPEEAKEFLALLLKNLDNGTQYTLFTDKTEPIENEGSKEWYDSVVESIETIKEMLETAEGSSKEELEEALKNNEESLVYAELERWLISPDDIKEYQKCIPYMKALDYFFLYDIFDSSDIEELREQYDNIFGEGNVEEVLNMIDKKITTSRKEGN